MIARSFVSGVLILVAALLLHWPSAAAAQDLVRVIGPTQFEIPTRDARTSIILSIPVSLTVPALPAGIELQTVRVSLAGRNLDPSAVEFEMKPSGASGRAMLVATIDPEQVEEAGTYTAVMEVPRPGQQARRAGEGGEAAQQEEPQRLEFTFIKPAAELHSAQPVKVERVVYIPWLWARLSLDKLLLTETTGRSPLIPYHPEWTDQLQRINQGPTSGRIRVRLPEAIEPWGQGEATLAIDGDLPLGTATGTLTVRSLQLAAPRATNFSLEVVSRVSLFWLLIVLATGIYAGYYARTHLERRRRRAEAMIAVEEQRGLLHDLIAKSVDQGLRGELQTVLDRLTADVGSARVTPDALNAAAQRAKGDTDKVLEEADKRRAEARTQIANRTV